MINKKIGLIALLASVAAGDIMANDLTSYAVGDVLICFRKGGNDMVVDAGPISTFTSLSANQRYTISSYTGTQLADVGTNGMSWSAFTWTANDTLYVTRPRSSLNLQSRPWLASTASSQSGVVARMNSIPLGALDELNLMVYPESTATAVIEEDSSAGNPNYTTGVSYHDALNGSYGGNFAGNFAGNPENTTLSTFTKGGTSVRSDFYQITPSFSYSVGTLLGYFELATNGVMTYVAYPSTVPAITSFTRTGTTSTIPYTTGVYGTYTLRGTNSLTSGTPQTSWPIIATLSSGTGNYTVTDTNTNAVQFYTITAQ